MFNGEIGNFLWFFVCLPRRVMGIELRDSPVPAVEALMVTASWTTPQLSKLDWGHQLTH
jgi:hypothetical protein